MNATMNATMTKTSRAINRLRDSIESIRHTDPVDLSAMEVGEEHPQGDLTLIRLPDDFVVKNAHLLVRREGAVQLARGSTQGSRHCLDGLSGVTFYSLADGNVLDGPVIRTSEPRSILHPEHGDLVNIPPGTYGIQYQRQLAEELRAAAD